MLLHIRHSSFDGRLLDGIADNVKYVVKARIELGQVASRQSTRVKTYTHLRIEDVKEYI